MIKLAMTAGVPREAFFVYSGTAGTPQSNHTWGGNTPYALAITHNKNTLCSDYEFFHQTADGNWVRRKNFDSSFNTWAGWDANYCGNYMDNITLSGVTIYCYNAMDIAGWQNYWDNRGTVNVRVYLYA